MTRAARPAELLEGARRARAARDAAQAAYADALVAAYYGRGERTVQEVADELGVSKQYLHRLVARRANGQGSSDPV